MFAARLVAAQAQPDDLIFVKQHKHRLTQMTSYCIVGEVSQFSQAGPMICMS